MIDEQESDLVRTILDRAYTRHIASGKTTAMATTIPLEGNDLAAKALKRAKQAFEIMYNALDAAPACVVNESEAILVKALSMARVVVKDENGI